MLVAAPLLASKAPLLLASTQAAVASSLPAVLPASLMLAAEVPGPQFVDIFYVLGVLAVGAFGVRTVFDSIFPENDEYVPPMPALSKIPIIGALFDDPTGGMDPAEKAEELRQKIAAAAAAGDIETAYYTEKELKQLLAETGVRYMADAVREEDLPERW